MRRASSSRTATGASSVSAVAVKPAGRFGDGVEVAHPHVVHVGGVVGEQQRRAGAAQLGPAVLAAHAAPDGAAELLGDQLGAVADAEDRHAELVDRRIERRGAVDVDRLRAAGQDQRGGPAGGDLGGGDAVRDDLGVDRQLAHPTGDELGVLGAEVDDEDGVLVAGGGRSIGRRLGQGLDRSWRW